MAMEQAQGLRAPAWGGLCWRSSDFLIWNSCCSMLCSAHLWHPCYSAPHLHSQGPFMKGWKKYQPWSSLIAEWSRGWAYICSGQSTNRKAWNSQGGGAEVRRGRKGAQSQWEGRATPAVSICPYPKVFKCISERTELLYPIQGRDSN